MKINKESLEWLNTNKLYNQWVSKKEIRNFFSNNVCYEGLSLWWISRVVGKDNVIENQWYYELKKILHHSTVEFRYNWLVFFLKLIKNLFKNFIDLIYFKLVNFFCNSSINKRNLNYENCFHSFSYNFKKFNNNYSDRLYGKAPFLNLKKNFYLITAKDRKLSLFKKKIIDYYISNAYLGCIDFLKIYFITLCKLVHVKKFLDNNSHLFIINKIDCSSVLKPLIFDSFCGYIQNSLIEALSIKNFLKNKKVNNFICYGEFHSGYRAVYYFVKKTCSHINIATIHHGYANENLLFFNHKKEEFNLKYEEGKNCSPMPDQYFVQGVQFKNILKKYYPKKISIIGCLKYDFVKFKKQKNKIKKTLKTLKIVVAPSIGDEKDILLYLKELSHKNKIDVKNIQFYLSPHPVIKKKTIEVYKKNLPGIKLLIPDKTTLEITRKCDLLICGFSTVAYEAALIGKPSLRVINSNSPILFHVKDEINKIYNVKEFLNEVKKKKHKLANRKKIEKYFYYKLDGNAAKRFWKQIN